MSSAKKSISLAAFLILTGAAVYGFQYPIGIGGGQNKGTLAPEVQKKGPTVRSVTGVVLDQGDSPIAHAVVYLKNTKTLTVKTYISNDTGNYQFTGLVPNQDYELYAQLSGNKSPTKTLSGFDSREKATLNLHIDQTKKNNDQDKKNNDQDKKSSDQDKKSEDSQNQSK
jgi:hypothetical protein